MFRPTGNAPARAARVASVLEGAGHEVSKRPLSRGPAGVLAVLRDSPELVHACGSDVWRAAGLAANLARASVVYEALDGERGDRSRRGVARAVREGRRGGAVLAGGEHQATQLRSSLGLYYVPPVVGALEPVGPPGGGADVLTAVYERLPRLNPAPPRTGGAVAGRRGRLARELLDPIRRGGLRHPVALASYLRGRTLRARGRSRDAAGALSRACARDRGNATYGLYLSRALSEAGSGADAAEVLRAFETGGSERDLPVLGEVGVELARLGLAAEAREVVLRLREAGERGDSDSAEALVGAAQVSVALGELGEASELASAAAALAGDRSRAQRTAAQVLERAGEPSAALELARRCGATEQQARVSGLLRTLEPGWAPQPALARPFDRADDRRVLCALEVSLPHAPSGYAYRSRDLLAAIRAAGLDPVAATRLGFPASRGSAAYSPVESVDEAIHHRLTFPGLRQYSGIPLDRQVEVNVECLLALAARTRPGVVIAGTPNLNGAVALALRSALGTPVIYDVRGFPEMSWATQPGGSERELYRLRRKAETACAAAADAVITLSETMKSELVGRGLDSDRVFTVPHVVDTDRYSPRPRDEGLARSYGIDGSFTVGSVTTLTDYEGIDALLRAVALARATRPDVAALIVGDGPARASLEALAAELGIEDGVVFTGRIDHDRVPEHYALLDLFALPRRDLEVCRFVTPLKPFEAMAMGIPLLASELPALAEPVSASGGGRLVEAGFDRGLADAILELADDEGVRERLGSLGREHAVAHHAPARAAAAIGSALAAV